MTTTTDASRANHDGRACRIRKIQKRNGSIVPFDARKITVAILQAFSNFDTLLAPFIAYDGLNHKQVKQALQSFVFNLNVPTRVGFSTPFTNLSFDLKPPAMLANESVRMGGEIREEFYGDFQEEMDMLDSTGHDTPRYSLPMANRRPTAKNPTTRIRPNCRSTTRTTYSRPWTFRTTCKPNTRAEP